MANRDYRAFIVEGEAREPQIIDNPRHPEDPWYYEDEVVFPFETAFSTFEEGSLRKLNY